MLYDMLTSIDVKFPSILPVSRLVQEIMGGSVLQIFSK